MTGKTTTEKKISIIMDSNALFVPLQFKIDITEELKRLLGSNFELILISPIRRELEQIAEKGSPKTKRRGSFALKLADKCTLVEVHEEKPASPDDLLVKIGREWGCPIFTNDRQLRKRLRNINVPVIYVRQRSRLEIDGRL
jgi:hypothetical protein